MIIILDLYSHSSSYFMIFSLISLFPARSARSEAQLSLCLHQAFLSSCSAVLESCSQDQICTFQTNKLFSRCEVQNRTIFYSGECFRKVENNLNPTIKPLFQCLDQVCDLTQKKQFDLRWCVTQTIMDDCYHLSQEKHSILMIECLERGRLDPECLSSQLGECISKRCKLPEHQAEEQL